MADTTTPVIYDSIKAVDFSNNDNIQTKDVNGKKVVYYNGKPFYGTMKMYLSDGTFKVVEVKKGIETVAEKTYEDKGTLTAEYGPLVKGKRKDLLAAAAETTKKDEEILTSLQTLHPQWAQWIIEHPELKKTILEWAKIPGGPTQTQIDAAVYPTTIVQEYNAIQQNLDKLKALSPGEYKSRVEKAAQIADMEIASQGVKISSDDRQKIIDATLNNGWSSNDPRLVKAVGAFFKASEVGIGTAGATVVSDLKKLADKYMIPMAKVSLDDLGRQIADGTTTLADQETWFKQQAASLYPFMAGTIDTTPPSTWFSPLQQLIATNLEVPAASVDWNDPSGKWMNLATKRDEKTGATVARSLAEATKEMRTNKIYGYENTQGAKDSALALASQIRSMMGFGA